MSITVDTAKATPVGENIQAIIVGENLVLVINTKTDLGPSKSGKMDGVASTGGFQKFPAGLKGNIYIGK